MPFSTRSDSELESALDALGFSSIADIPVVINPRFQPPTRLLNEVQQLLSIPVPEMDPNWSRFDGSLERQVLDQLKLMDQEKKERERKEEEEIQNYLEEKKRKEEEEAAQKKLKQEQEEAEKKKKELEAAEKMKAEEELKEKLKRDANNSDEGQQELEDNSLGDTESIPSEAKPVMKPASAPLNMPHQNPSIPLNGRMVLPPIPNIPTIATPKPTLQGTSSSGGKSAIGQINYSEFERETDPFESLELKSINDFQELAAVLQTTTSTTSINPAISGINASTSQLQQHQQIGQFQTPGMVYQRPNVPHQPRAGMNNPYPSTNAPYSGVSLLYNSPYYQPQQQFQPQPHFYNVPSSMATTNFNTFMMNPTPQINQPVTLGGNESNLKASKSYGDLLSEMEKEEMERDLNLNLNLVTGVGKEKQRKKSSVTPPPRLKELDDKEGKQSTSKKILDDWVPWPDLDVNPGSVTKGILKKTKPPEPDPLDLLSSDYRKSICRQIAEMGFPLGRVVRACQALNTEDTQQIINFCLLVSKFVEEEKFSELEVEHVLLMNSMNEQKARMHLKGFTQLEVLGFDSKSIHDALMECGGSHDKALEKLLK